MKLNSICLNNALSIKKRNNKKINGVHIPVKIFKNISIDSYMNDKSIQTNIISNIKRFTINAIKKKFKENNKIENSCKYSISLPILDISKNMEHPKSKIHKSFEAFKKVPAYHQRFFKANSRKKNISSNYKKYQQEQKWFMVTNYNPKEIDISCSKESELNKYTTLQKWNKSEEEHKMKIFKIKVEKKHNYINDEKESEDDIDNIKLNLYNFIKNGSRNFDKKRKSNKDKSMRVINEKNINK